MPRQKKYGGEDAYRTVNLASIGLGIISSLQIYWSKAFDAKLEVGVEPTHLTRVGLVRRGSSPTAVAASTYVNLAEGIRWTWKIEKRKVKWKWKFKSRLLRSGVAQFCPISGFPIVYICLVLCIDQPHPSSYQRIEYECSSSLRRLIRLETRTSADAQSVVHIAVAWSLKLFSKIFFMFWTSRKSDK